MEAWFQRFEAEEQRQRMIAQAMKDSTKTAEGSIASESKEGNDKDAQQVVEVEVAWVLAEIFSRSKYGNLFLASKWIHSGQNQKFNLIHKKRTTLLFVQNYVVHSSSDWLKYI